MAETIICPKCNTETSIEKSQCEYCGKVIIAEIMAAKSGSKSDPLDPFSDDIDADSFLNPKKAKSSKRSTGGIKTSSSSSVDAPEPQKSDDDDEDLFAELGPASSSVSADDEEDDDLFADLEPLEIEEPKEDEDVSESSQSVAPPTMVGKKGIADMERKDESDEPSSMDDIPKFENPMEKSSFMKKFAEDYDLFKDLDEEDEE